MHKDHYWVRHQAKGNKDIALAKRELNPTTLTTFFNNIPLANIAHGKGVRITTNMHLCWLG